MSTDAYFPKPEPRWSLIKQWQEKRTAEEGYPKAEPRWSLIKKWKEELLEMKGVPIARPRESLKRKKMITEYAGYKLCEEDFIVGAGCVGKNPISIPTI